MPEELLAAGGGKSHWVIIGIVVLVALYLVTRGGSSSGAGAALNASANANAAAVEQSRLTAASSAYSSYLAAQTAALQSNNAVRINSQNVSGAEAIAATEAQAQQYSAHVAGRTSTNNGLLGTIGGIVAGVLGGLL